MQTSACVRKPAGRAWKVRSMPMAPPATRAAIRWMRIGRYSSLTGAGECSLDRQETFDGEVALAGIVVEAEDPRALGDLLQLRGDGGQRRAGRNADQQPLARGALAGVLPGIL